MQGKKRHLNNDDRRFIEVSLRGGVSFAFMAKKLGVHDTTITREIKRNMVEERSPKIGSSACENSWRCEARALCGQDCGSPCKDCAEIDCTLVCGAFARRTCPRTLRKPHVCNGCAAVQYGADCGFARRFYDAEIAQRMSDERLCASRAGIGLTGEELEAMVDVVRPLLRKGQSLEHIWATHPGEFPVTARTFYKYIEDGLLDICNIELPKKVRYKKRRCKRSEPSLNPLYDGRPRKLEGPAHAAVPLMQLPRSHADAGAHARMRAGSPRFRRARNWAGGLQGALRGDRDRPRARVQQLQRLGGVLHGQGREEVLDLLLRPQQTGSERRLRAQSCPRALGHPQEDVLRAA